MSLLEELNTEQRRAVEAGEGPVIIVAGPGTGKTKTLTARTVHLITSGQAKPEEVLALTFTNKSAREMQERVRELLPGGRAPVMGTFHALARRLLADRTGDRRLITELERSELLAVIRKNHQLKGMTTRDVSLLVSLAKNRLEPAEDGIARELVAVYNAELLTRNLYDFDDLLLELYDFLQDESHRQPYRHILVDEFQDTNELQYALLARLNTTDNLFVIGDPLQSIYGFRGASAAVFDRFARDWPTASTITLTTNYRSAPAIVRVAGAVFPDAPQLKAHRTGTAIVRVMEVLNEYGEADWIVNEIERQVGGSDMLRSSKHHADDRQRTFRDFAILYRTHAVAKTVQRALESGGIPYQVAGEGSPYEQLHIQAITQALGYIAGRGEAPRIKGHTVSQIEALLATVDAEQPLPKLVSRIIELFDLATEKHAASLRQFTNSLVPFEDKPLTAYLDYLQSIAEQEYYDPAADKVTLLTIHAAKGLEFSRVFLIAAEGGILPHTPKGKAGGAPASQEEERRLFYVALTRARDELYLLHARNRSGEQRQLSSFITSLPADVIKRTVDPAMADQKRRIQRRQQKRAQGTLF